LFIPAMEKRAITWMFHCVSRVPIDVSNGQPCHELRNPLAFAHEGLNLLAAQMMSKPARISLRRNNLWSARTCPRFQSGPAVAGLPYS
jgi:hypothetical protein